MGQYYANPNNQFWKIIYSVFGSDNIFSADKISGAATVNLSYDEKMRFLLFNKIALWDIFHSAERKGALDADIKSETPNDIPGLLRSYPGIRRIITAGRKAESSVKKYFPDIGVDVVYVPSASPAYAGLSLDDKIQRWRSAVL